jgi:uncharacterized repeat protein (TIGR01451 family)
MPITFVRKQPAVTLTKTCDPTTFSRGDTTNCTITIQNTSFDTATVNLFDPLPRELNLVRGSVSGATALGDLLFFRGSLYGAAPPEVTVGTGTSPNGSYLPLSLFGIAPLTGVGDETITNFNVPAFTYAGETYTRIGMVSDGYLVVGGGTGADVQFVNQSLPDPTPPNNVLAPFWTDLNPGVGGTMRVGILTGGGNSWLVFDWESVPNYSGGSNSFEVWVGINGVQDISFSYGPDLTSGDSGTLTVGAENKYGNRGANYYYSDGTTSVGTLPTPNFDAVVVNSVPGAPGESHVITFTAKGVIKGKWTNCALMTGDIFFGTNTACFSGEVVR